MEANYNYHQRLPPPHRMPPGREWPGSEEMMYQHPASMPPSRYLPHPDARGPDPRQHHGHWDQYPQQNAQPRRKGGGGYEAADKSGWQLQPGNSMQMPMQPGYGPAASSSGPAAAAALGKQPKTPATAAALAAANRGAAASAAAARPDDDDGRGFQSNHLTYADVSRGIQRIFKEKQEPMVIAELERAFTERFGEPIETIAGVPTRDYLLRKSNVFWFDKSKDEAYLHQSILSGPPIQDPNTPKDEAFVMDEFEGLIEDLGPICYVSALCGKFIQRNGLSVTSITSVRPLDLLKRNPDRFVIVGGGNVSLAKFKDHPEVKNAMASSGGKSQRAARALLDAQIPVPEMVTEQDVINEFQRLIMNDGAQAVYISSLCGRFLQRFKKPVTQIINSRPADFLRKYPEIFDVVGGGNVKLTPAAMENWENGGTEGLALKGRAASESEVGGKDAGVESEPEDDRPEVPLSEALCMKILGKISPPGHAEVVRRRVTELAQSLQKECFLALQDVVVAGAPGKNVVITNGAEDAELVLLVENLPDGDHDKWLSHILDTLMAVLEMRLANRARNCRTCGGGRALLTLEPEKSVPDSQPLLVFLSVTHCVNSRQELYRQMRNCNDELVSNFLLPGLMREVVELIAEQPPNVLATMKLLHWWASQQMWPTRSQPPPYLLELLVLEAALRPLAGHEDDNDPIREVDSTIPVPELLEATLELCSRLPELSITWKSSSFVLYAPSEVDEEVLEQKPLILDPTNPCVNVAMRGNFNPVELSLRTGRRCVSGRLRFFHDFELSESCASSGTA